MKLLFEINTSIRKLIKKKRLKSLNSILILPLLFIFLASCTNNIIIDDSTFDNLQQITDTNENEKTVLFTGQLQTEGAISSQILSLQTSKTNENPARTATPTLDFTSDSLTFFATATDSNGNTFSGSFNTSNSGLFEMSLNMGSIYTITCGIKNSDNVTILQASYTTPGPLETPLSHLFYLTPVTDGNGSIELNMTVDINVTSASATSSNPVWNSLSPSISLSGTSATLSINSIPCGVYEVELSFFNTSNILLFSTSQTINVLKGLSTNAWASSGDGTELIGNDGTFNLTSTLIESYKRSVFYVGQSDAATNVGNSASDTNGTGSAYQPFESISKACQIINSIGNSSANYKIFICGKLNSAQEIPNSLTLSKAASLTIQGYNGLDLNGEPQDGIEWTTTTNSTTTTNLLLSNSRVPLTIKNLLISNTSESTRVRGIQINYAQNVTLSSGTIIRGMKTQTEPGAGIRCTDASVLNIDGGIIENCQAGITSNSKLGGGICTSGTVNLISGQISSCSAPMGQGGAIYISQGGTLDIKGGTITSNNAYQGGGIYFEGHELKITGGTISENTVTNGSGGAIYIPSLTGTGKLTLGASAYIPYGSGNDIKLGYDGIIIESNLTATSPIATISPKNYAQGQFILEEDNTNNKSNYSKFSICSESSSSTNTWKINEEGVLYKYFSLNNYNSITEFEIYTKEQIETIFSNNTIGTFEGKTITLYNDFEVSQACYKQNFRGTFDGNGHTITINSTGVLGAASNGCGLFAQSYGTIKNLTVAGSFTAPISAHYVGAIAGICYSGSGSIQNCTSTANITVNGYSSTDDSSGVGGITGKAWVSIYDNTFSGTINAAGARYVGGIVGYSDVTVCRNTISGSINYTGTNGLGIGKVIGNPRSDYSQYVYENTSTAATLSYAEGTVTENYVDY